MSKRGSILGCLKLSWAILKPSWEHLRSKWLFGRPPGPRRFGSERFFVMLWTIFCHCLDHFGMILWTIFLSLFGSLLGTILGAIFGPELQRPKKATFSKKWFSRETVCIFSLLRPPKELLNPKKKGSKIDPKINTFWTNFGVQKSFNFGPILGFKKGTPNRTKTCFIFFMITRKVNFSNLLRRTFGTHFGTPS